LEVWCKISTKLMIIYQVLMITFLTWSKFIRILLLHHLKWINASLDPLFLTSKNKFFDEACWVVVYKSLCQNKNSLYLLSKHLTKDVTKLRGMIITIKIGKGIAIFWFVNSLMLIKYDMKMSGHQDLKSYSN